MLLFVTLPLSLADLETYYQTALTECHYLRKLLKEYKALLEGRMKPSALVSVNFNRLERYFLAFLEHLKWRTSDLAIDEAFGLSDHPAAVAIREVEYTISEREHPIDEDELDDLLTPVRALIPHLKTLIHEARVRRLKSVFLCHSSKDKAFARQLAADLTRAGARIWLDEAEIKIGDSLVKRISEGIEETDFLAVILTPDSVSSEWVQRELEVALNLEINERRVRALPLLLRDCSIPPFLAGKLYGDFRTEDKYEAELAKVIDRLKA